MTVKRSLKITDTEQAWKRPSSDQRTQSSNEDASNKKQKS